MVEEAVYEIATRLVAMVMTSVVVMANNNGAMECCYKILGER